jgi:hypothetical protein
MPNATKKTTRSIRLTQVKTILLSGLLVTIVAIALQFYFSLMSAREALVQKYQRESAHIRQTLKQEQQTAESHMTLLADFNSLITGKQFSSDALPILANLLYKNSLYSSINLGFPNGDLQQFIDLDKPDNIAQQLPEMESARWLLISKTYQGKQSIVQYAYFDQSLTLIKERQSYKSDGVKLAWYQQAVLTQSSSDIGKTYAITIPKTNAVLALDLHSNALPEILKIYTEQQNTDRHEIYAFIKHGETIESNQSGTNTNLTPVLDELTQHSSNLNKLNSIAIDETTYYAYVTKIQGANNYLAFLMPQTTLFFANFNQLLVVGVTGLLLTLCLSWLLSLPLTHKFKALLMAIEEAKEIRFKKIKTTETDITEFQQLNDLIMEMSYSIKNYQTKQKQQIESFIKLTAQAIANQSPYAREQANKVPELAWMLLKAVEDSQLPVFKDFKLKNNDQQQSFRITAALHSYDKITTSQSLASKSTKLEATYNRIHEIRMRFEILWRDAEIYYYQTSRDNPEQNKSLKEGLIKQQLQLMRDFEFVANANIGDQAMKEQDIQRLHQIGSQTWLRYFDDRLGLSSLEKMTLSTQKQKLPAQEYLLSDKPEHLVPQQNKNELLAASPTCCNLGELYNLSIPVGTLTEEDKQQLNAYIVKTSSLLDDMPVMIKQHNVPQDLTTYHPALSDAVYLVNSGNKKLSIAEHILGITYIFESLTSINNPQHKIETISNAIAIMHQLVMDKRIDKHIFKLFLSSGIYLTYAKQFLYEQQIDEVDIQQYLD